MHLRLIVGEINLRVNVHIGQHWTIVFLPRTTTVFWVMGLAWGDVIHVVDGVEEPKNLHNFGASIAYLLPAWILRFVGTTS